jgi:hypothetical protein
VSEWQRSNPLYSKNSQPGWVDKAGWKEGEINIQTTASELIMGHVWKVAVKPLCKNSAKGRCTSLICRRVPRRRRPADQGKILEDRKGREIDRGDS